MGGEGVPAVDREAMEELTANISQTVVTLFSAGGVLETLAQVVTLAVGTIEGCDFAGISLVGTDGERPQSSDPRVDELEALQRQTGEGPSIEAVQEGVAVYASDFSNEGRWPAFGAGAQERGIRSLLTVPFMTNVGPGALDLYACAPQAFGVGDRGRALLLAAMAGLAVTSARAHEDEERRAANLHAALATREAIGQAQGILMEREHVTPERAFDILRRASQHLNVKLRDIAQNLIDTGERPDTGRS
jgi:GAF domain-containing protein